MHIRLHPKIIAMYSRAIHSLILVFVFGNLYGQSSAIGLHIGSVPNCTQLSSPGTRNSSAFSNQCYSFGLSYHRLTKRNSVFTFRAQYQNRSETKEDNFDFKSNDGNFTNKEVVSSNNTQKEIILFPSIYWRIGEKKLRPIAGVGLPLKIRFKDEQSFKVDRTFTSKEINQEVRSTFKSMNNTKRDGNMAIGIAAEFGMNYQLAQKIQFQFSYTPTVFFQKNTTEVKNNFNSKETVSNIFNGIPDPNPEINTFSDNQTSEETLNGIIFQKDLFLFSLLYQF